MSAESQLFDILKSVIGGTSEDPKVFPDVAPEGYLSTPYITYQQVGGESLEFLERGNGDKKNARVMIRVWHTNRLLANQLARLVEDYLVGAAGAALQASALGALFADYDEEKKLRGTRQDFSIWFAD